MTSPSPAKAPSTFREWIEQNPLRAWRLGQDPKVTIIEAAGRVGVGMSMVQMYERGAHKPGPDKAEALARVLGPDWSDRWDSWLGRRPA